MKTTIHVKICITSNIKPRPISALWLSGLGLILESRVDMECDTDFAMHYSLFITLLIFSIHVMNYYVIITEAT